MFKYKVSVTTGKKEFAETINDIYVTLVGTESSSDRTQLDKSVVDHFARGSVRIVFYLTNSAQTRRKLLCHVLNE